MENFCSANKMGYDIKHEDIKTCTVRHWTYSCEERSEFYFCFFSYLTKERNNEVVPCSSVDNDLMKPNTNFATWKDTMEVEEHNRDSNPLSSILLLASHLLASLVITAYRFKDFYHHFVKKVQVFKCRTSFNPSCLERGFTLDFAIFSSVPRLCSSTVLSIARCLSVRI